MSITLNPGDHTVALADDNGLLKASNMPADFSRTEVRFHYGRSASFSIDWLVNWTDLTAAEIFTAGKRTLISTFLCEDVTRARRK